MASELLYPILPLFITTVLGAPVAVVSVTEGIADGLAAITKIFSGRLSDRYRRRPLVFVGYGLAAIGKILVALATVWPIVLIARMIDRFGKGVRGVPRDALIAEDVPKEFAGRAFGFHRTMDSLGASIGPLMGLGLFEVFHHHYRPVFVVAIVPAVLSALAVGFVRETKIASPTSGPVSTSRTDRIDRTNPERLPKAFWPPFVMLTTFAFINFSDALLILRAKHLGLSVSAVIAAYVLYNLTYTLASYPAGVLADKISKHVLIASGFLVFGVAYAGLGLVHDAIWVWPLLALYGFYTALTDGVTKAWIVTLVPTSIKGRALGLQAGWAGVGTVVAGIWAGVTWHGSGRVPLIVAGVIAMILGLGVLLTGAGIKLKPADNDVRVA